MSTVADVIAAARVELEDGDSTRWTDAKLLVLIKKCIRRASDVLWRRQISFARSLHEFDTVIDTATYDLPTDFGVQSAMYNSTDDDPVCMITDEEWELTSDIELLDQSQYWRINTDEKIQLAGTPTSVESMKLYYWPDIDVSAYTTASTMPWSGRLDDTIEEYLTLRCKNIDEMDVSFDVILGKDITENRLNKYASILPTQNVVTGFFD